MKHVVLSFRFRCLCYKNSISYIRNWNLDTISIRIPCIVRFSISYIRNWNSSFSLSISEVWLLYFLYKELKPLHAAAVAVPVFPNHSLSYIRNWNNYSRSGFPTHVHLYFLYKELKPEYAILVQTFKGHGTTLFSI